MRTFSRRGVIFLITLWVMSLLFGCEHDSQPDNDYYSSYSYDGYVYIFVDNQSVYDVVVVVGNAPYKELEPGDATYVSKNLVGNQALWIRIDFVDDNGFQFYHSETFDFHRRNHQQNLVIYGPGDVRDYK